jgi:hypothetical protein
LWCVLIINGYHRNCKKWRGVIIVFLATVLGLLILIFILGEILFPH